MACRTAARTGAGTSPPGMRRVATLPGGKRVDAQVGNFIVRTDQPRESGGDDIQLPPSFPSEHRDAVVRAAMTCKVKKTLAAPPDIDVRASTSDVAVSAA